MAEDFKTEIVENGQYFDVYEVVEPREERRPIAGAEQEVVSRYKVVIEERNSLIEANETSKELIKSEEEKIVDNELEVEELDKRISHYETILPEEHHIVEEEDDEEGEEE